MKNVLSVLTDILLVFIIFILLFNIFLFFNFERNYSIFSYSIYIDISDSMAPTIQAGDLVIAKSSKISELGENDIIVFEDDDSNLLITHRIVEVIKENGSVSFRTKGDNNTSFDINLVESENVVAKYLFKITGLGNLLLFFTTPLGSVGVLLIIITVLLIGYLSLCLRRER